MNGRYGLKEMALAAEMHTDDVCRSAAPAAVREMARAAVIAAVMVLVIITAGTSAVFAQFQLGQVPNERDGQVIDPFYLKTMPSASGTGWSWDADKKVLTLEGMDMDLTANDGIYNAAIELPDGGATIVVKEKTSHIKINGVTTGATGRNMAIWSVGDITFLGDGILEIEALERSNGIAAGGNIWIGDKVTFKGPAIDVYAEDFAIASGKCVTMLGSTVEAGTTGNSENCMGAIFAGNGDKELAGVVMDETDLMVSTAGDGSAGITANYGDVVVTDSSVLQAPVIGTKDTVGIEALNGTVYVTKSECYFDLGQGKDIGGAFICSDFGDAGYKTDRKIFLNDSTIRGMDAESGYSAEFGGVVIKGGKSILTTQGYTIDCGFQGLQVEKAKVDIKSTGDYYAGCARVGGPVTIKDATVIGEAMGEMSAGLIVNGSKATFSGKTSNISFKGVNAGIEFNMGKQKGTAPLTLKNDLVAMEGGRLQAVKESDGDYTWSYSTETLKTNASGEDLGNAAKEVVFKKGLDNPIKVTAKKNVKVSAALLKKKSKTLKRKKILTVSKQKGTVTYKKVSVNKSGGKFKINKKTGALTIKKGTKKGTYKVRIRVTASGSGKYIPGSRTVTVNIKVK